MAEEPKSEWIEEKCPKCDGTGAYSDMRPVRVGHPVKNASPSCPQCRGLGKIKRKRAT